MFLLKRWHGKLHLLHKRRVTAIQFPSTFDPPTQQQPSAPPVTTHLANTADDEDIIDADHLNRTWRKIYNALRQETIPRDVRSSLFPTIQQQLESLYNQVMDSTNITPNARFQRQDRH